MLSHRCAALSLLHCAAEDGVDVPCEFRQLVHPINRSVFYHPVAVSFSLVPRTVAPADDLLLGGPASL